MLNTLNYNILKPLEVVRSDHLAEHATVMASVRGREIGAAAISIHDPDVTPLRRLSRRNMGAALGLMRVRPSRADTTFDECYFALLILK